MSAKGSGSGTVRDTAKAFSLGSSDSIRKDFNDITELNAVQSFRLPVSGFSFNPSESDAENRCL